ncbi:MAG: polyol transport system substrate-binding protein [Solirubrobacteraceae bacterium]|jgi:sorbitol/mannitol transport system substrate-binding protein|nr:polyol transport system substrate-binding protein [Solirubrobacteraceae bacterium]
MLQKRVGLAAVVAACASIVALTGCGAGGGGGSKTVRVLMVNNPQMVDLQKLAGTFTKETGIKVDFKVLPENDVRDTIAQDVANQAGQYDVITISNFEVPFYAKNGWLTSMSDFADKDPAFDQADILKPMTDSLKGPDGKLYGVPFYGESSMLMYRKDVFAKKGLTMPDHPTWNQVAALAAKLDGAEPGMKGICLRGQPGWGEVMAPLTTVVNTFGGTWFTKDWQTQVNSAPFKQATNFYVDLVRKHGESGASQAGFTECLNNMSQGRVAMWYDATSAAGALENPAQSKVAGKVGYAYAPVDKTKSSGWLYTWAWGIEKASKHPDNAWKFVSWASGKEYQKLVGQKLGWAKVPDGTRQSLYDNPQYQKAAAAFYKVILGSISTANPADPGVQPRPTLGIQFVDIPEFTKLGTDVSQLVSSAIAGQTPVSSALDQGQQLAEQVAQKYRSK